MTPAERQERVTRLRHAQLVRELNDLHDQIAETGEELAKLGEEP